MVLDDIHVASMSEEFQVLGLLGEYLNEPLAQGIKDGSYLVALDFQGMEDPSGQSDDERMSVGVYRVDDSDSNRGDNFDAESPETFKQRSADRFRDAQVHGGELEAEGLDTFALPGFRGVSVPLNKVSLSGTLVPTSSSDGVLMLQDGRLTGGIPIRLIALAGQFMGDQVELPFPCRGKTVLDKILLGCGLGFSFAQIVDIDGDGEEQFFDEDGDGAIDVCVDGDGTRIRGTRCVTDERIKDGIEITMVVHGVRAYLAP